MDNWARSVTPPGLLRTSFVLWQTRTDIIKPGQYEAVYSGMPPYGLGKWANWLPQPDNAKPRVPA